MHIANIVPPQWTGVFPQGSYRMALAHWVLAHKGYAQTIGKNNSYVLMDNGAFEEEQVSTSRINQAASAVRASEIVLPDLPGDAKETLKRSWAALGHIKTKRVMFIPHGNTHEELERCLDLWIEKWEASSWKENYFLSLGITSLRKPGTFDPQIGSRYSIIKKVTDTGYPSHLLGVPDPKEFLGRELPIAFSLGVRGFDTSLAFALASKGILLTSKAPKIHLGDPSKYEMLTTKVRRLVFLNQAILKSRSEGHFIDVVPTNLIRSTAQRWSKYWAEGFVPLQEPMRACGMPLGRYALKLEDGREKYVYLLEGKDEPRDEEDLLELS